MICGATLRRTTPTGTGRVVGLARFVDTPQGLAVRVEVEGLKPGQYGMHLHEYGACGPGWSEADKATIPGGAAGPHYDPRKTGSHRGPEGGGHAGDLPRFVVTREGVTKQDFLVRGIQAVELSGRTLIIHEGGDNYADRPRPNGGAGGRQICGSILPLFPSRAEGSRAEPSSTEPAPTLAKLDAHGQTYLCASERAEHGLMQPMRLATGLVAAPLVGYGAWTLREQRPVLATGLATIAVGMSAWSLYAWTQVNSLERSP